MRKVVVLRGSKVYHEQDCRYLKHSKTANRIYVKPGKAEEDGCRPCKCCGSISYRFDCMRKALDRFIKGKNMEYKISGGFMYVKTEISCWKIVYVPKNKKYGIYHRNHSDKPIDFQNPESESYHVQLDKKCAKTILECFKYIRSHDSYRKSEQETGGKTNMTNVSPKYRRHIAKVKRRRAQRRVDSLFEKLERENPEYAALAYC